MKETQEILQAYKNCKALNQKIALATVVKVDGSAYRRPGARMLVTEDGELTGAISGGCLEGDALRKAQSVIFQAKSMLATYDTTDEDDQKFGVGLGCNGIIQVLIEPIAYEDNTNPVELLKIALEKRVTCTLITVFSLKNSRSEQVGTKVLIKENQVIGNPESLDTELWNQIQKYIPLSLKHHKHIIKCFPGPEAYHVFFERIQPPVHLLLFGAGNDTMPLAKMAALLGWEISLIDGRKNHATKDRFPSATNIILGPADDVVTLLESDSNTVALLMTHNFEYEAVVLEQLLLRDLPYIGILGPKKKTDKLISRLEQKGISVNPESIYAPVGLEIGAEGAEEIALAALAEIMAVLSQKQPIHLKDKQGPIHEEER